MIRRHPPQVPAVLWVPAVLALALVVLPVAGLLTRVEPARLPGLLLSPAALDALRLSVITGLIATALAALLGVPLAVVLARSTLPGMRVVRALVLLPLVLPPVVGGLALLYLLGRTGPLGGVLAVAGIRLPYTTAAVVLSQTFVAMPFLVVGLEGALRTAGGRYEQVAATLGAGPWLAFRRVTLPLLLPALGSSLVLTFARALGEFGATMMVFGWQPGHVTLPISIYADYEQGDLPHATAAVVALSLISLGLVLAYNVTLAGKRD
jgi:molybdate transport system permease protein